MSLLCTLNKSYVNENTISIVEIVALSFALYVVIALRNYLQRCRIFLKRIFT